MENFGLGIIISVQDMASRGLNNIAQAFNDTKSTIQGFAQTLASDTNSINNSLSSLNSAMVAGMSAQQMGSMFSGLSNKMLSPLKSITSEVLTTSAQFENWGVTLEALYKDVAVAQEKLQWGMNLAAKTPFEIDTVTQALIGFKAIGVEADTQFKNANGQVRSLLEYMGDLGALRPDIGLEGVMLGVRNLLGGDGGKSLKMRMDMDFEAILGRKWGTTKEQLMQDLVEVSDKIANGLMTKMEGTWDQIISNLNDQKTRMYKAIGDAGVFDAVKDTLIKFSDVVNNIDDGKLAKIGANLKSAFSIIWKPIDLVAGALAKVVGKIADLVASDSALASVLTTFLAIGGALAGVIGAVLTLGGSIIQTVATLGTFSLMMAMNKAHVIALGGKLLSLVGVMGKLALLGGTVAIAWKADFLGIRSTLTNFKNTVSDAFTHSKDIANYSVSEMMRVLGNLDMTTFGGRLRFRLVQLRVLYMALCDAWNDNTLTNENFEKVQALGLLPLVNFILDAKIRIEAFCEGVVKGFNKVTEVCKKVFEAIGDVINFIGSLFQPALKDIDNVKNSAGEGIDTSKWTAFGEVVGVIGTVLLGVVPIVKVCGTVFSFLSGVVGKISLVFKVVMGVLTSCNPVVLGVIAVVTALAAAGIWLYKNWDTVKETFKNAIDTMVNKINEGCAWISTKFTEIGNNVKNAMETVKSNIETAWNNVWTSVSNWLSNIVSKIVEGWNNVVSETSSILSSIKDTVSNAFQGVKDAISNALTSAKDTATRLWNEIKSIFSAPITATVNFVKKGWEGVKNFVNGSHASGLSYVPFDGYIAELHKGERVLTAEENKAFSNPKVTPSVPQSQRATLRSSQGGVTNTTNDNSVVFNEGAIQITVAQGTEQDAKKLAKTIMAEIEKQTKLRNTLKYRTV